MPLQQHRGRGRRLDDALATPSGGDRGIAFWDAANTPVAEVFQASYRNKVQSAQATARFKGPSQDIFFFFNSLGGKKMSNIN